nr:hypothetical protein [Marinicella sp. W31]MDC2879874.1 hypothetical protein [Marinicella sp. W31]
MLKYQERERRLNHRHFSMSSSVSARAMIVAALAAGVPVGVAHADNECGTGPTVTCASGTYGSGITYSNITDLTLNLGNGVNVTDGVTITPNTSATNASIAVNIDTGSGTITNPPSTLYVDSKYVAAVNIPVSGTTDGSISATFASGALVSQGDGSGGVFIGSYTNTPNASYDFSMSDGSIELNGDQSFGVWLFNEGSGSSVIDVSGGTIVGNASAGASKQTGIRAQTFPRSSAGDTSAITMTGGSVTMHAANSAAVNSTAAGPSNSDVTLSGMTILTTGDALSTAANGRDQDGSAVVSQNQGSGDSNLAMLSGSVTTEGDYAAGLHSLIKGNDESVTGTALVMLNGGTVTTKGQSAAAVLAYNSTYGDAYAKIGGEP